MLVVMQHGADDHEVQPQSLEPPQFTDLMRQTRLIAEAGGRRIAEPLAQVVRT